MAGISSILDLVRCCKNVSLHGELVTLIELSKDHEDLSWKGGSRFNYDIECDGKRIEVKSCNTDNDWALREKRKGYLCSLTVPT